MIHLNNLMDKLARKIHKTKSISAEKKWDKIQQLLIATTLIKIEGESEDFARNRSQDHATWKTQSCLKNAGDSSGTPLCLL